jgi:hypothetical protein
MNRSIVRELPLTAQAAPVPEAEPAEEIYLTVIVRVTERPASLDDLYREYVAPIRELNRPFEFLFAIEPWARDLVQPLYELADRGEPIRILESARSVGEAGLLRLANDRGRGGIVLTMPAYQRVEPEAIPKLIAKIEQGEDMAVARRWPRSDRLVNRLQSRAFNFLLRKLIGQVTHDVACGVQAMRRDVLAETPMYGDFYRFLPVLAVREGFRVVEVDAPQHRRDRRTRIYSPGTYLRRLIDILGLFFLVRFTEKPLRFFGLVGMGLSVGGLIVLGFLFVQRQFEQQPIANRPMLLVGVTALTLGAQAIALGLIGEIIVHLSAARGARYRLLDDAPEDS